MIARQFIFLTFYLLLFTCYFAQAQWPTTVEDAIFVDFGLYPRLLVDPDDHSVYVVYLNTDDEILVKKYDQYGFPQWGGSAVVAAVSANFGQVGITGPVVSDDSGGVILCWEDFRNAVIPPIGFPEGSEVYIQRVDVNGQVRYEPNGQLISRSADEGSHQLGDLKADYHDGFVVAFRNDTTGSMSVVKRFNRRGEVIWQRNFNEGGIDLNAIDRDGNIFVSTWDNDTQRRHKFDLLGNSLWPDTLDGIIPDEPDVRGGGAFSDNRGGVIGVQTNLSVKHINRVDVNGNFVFGEGINITKGSSSIRYAPDSLGGIYLSWKNNDTDAIQAQRITYTGDSAVEPLEVCSGCAGSGDIIDDNAYGFVSMWGNFYGDTIKYSAQRFDSLGNKMWENSGTPFYSTTNNLIGFIDLNIYSDRRGGAIYTWIEQGQGLRIFIKQISRNGTLGEVITSIEPHLTLPIGLNQVTLVGSYPNPFNSEAFIEFKLLRTTQIQLEIFNTVGESVRMLINQQLPAGRHQILWNSRDGTGKKVSSGLYFYRIKALTEVRSGKMLLVQ